MLFSKFCSDKAVLVPDVDLPPIYLHFSAHTLDATVVQSMSLGFVPVRQRRHVNLAEHGGDQGQLYRHAETRLLRRNAGGRPQQRRSSIIPCPVQHLSGQGLHLNTNAVKSFFTQAELSAHQVARSTGGIGRSGRFARSNQRGPLGILKVGSHAGCKEAGYGRRSAPCAPGALFLCGIPVSVPQPGSSSRFLCEAE